MSAVTPIPTILSELSGKLQVLNKTQTPQLEWAQNRHTELKRATRKAKKFNTLEYHHDRCELILLTVLMDQNYPTSPTTAWELFLESINAAKLISEEAFLNWWAYGFATAWKRLSLHLTP